MDPHSFLSSMGPGESGPPRTHGISSPGQKDGQESTKMVAFAH